MSWKQWSAVLLVIGGGIVWQMKGHTNDAARHQHSGADTARTAHAASASAEAHGPYRTVALEVTGLT